MKTVTNISQQFVSKFTWRSGFVILGESIIEDEVSTTKDYKFIANG